MSDPTEISPDIAQTLGELMEVDPEIVARIGPETHPISSLKRPTVNLIRCIEGTDVVWHERPGTKDAAYDCGFDGIGKAAERIDRAAERINSEAIDSDKIYIELEGNQELVENIVNSIKSANKNDIEIIHSN
jgi:hypothetical protein